MILLCEMKMPDGSACGKPAAHHWGPIKLCCGHFDDLVIALYDLKDAVAARRHETLVKIYEASSKHLSRLIDAHCLDKKPDEEPQK